MPPEAQEKKSSAAKMVDERRANVLGDEAVQPCAGEEKEWGSTSQTLGKSDG